MEKNERMREAVFSGGRRGFLRTLAAGTAGFMFGAFGPDGCRAARAIPSGKSKVSFQTGSSHREVVFEALKPLRDEVGAAIQGKQVLIKVNMGQVIGPLNATHPDTVRGILDFLKPIYKKKVIVAESTAGSGRETTLGFRNFHYLPMLKEYKIDLVDLNNKPYSEQWIKDQNDHPLPINLIDTFLDPDIYMISATRLKSHNCVIATLSLKNVVMASPVNHYKRKVAKGRNEKSLMHSGGNRGLSYNIFTLARMGVLPDLAVLDGVVGMEGNGPVWGTPVEHGVALASTDWLAADRIGVELMGMDYSKIMYLRWCGQAGMGHDDLSGIDVVGPNYLKHIRTYRLHSNIAGQLDWVEKALSAGS